MLMEHPAVAQAVTFAVPHARLGEDIAAAVVLHQNAIATEHDIRLFARRAWLHLRCRNRSIL